jgi:TP901 family phage tail tape measure protein
MSKLRAILELDANTKGLEGGFNRVKGAIGSTADTFKKFDSSVKALKGFDNTQKSLVALQKNMGSTKEKLKEFQSAFKATGDLTAKSQMEHYTSVLKTQERQHRVMAKSMGQYKSALISAGVYTKALAKDEEKMTSVLKHQEAVRNRLSSKLTFDKKLEAIKGALPAAAFFGGNPAVGTAGFMASTLFGSGAGLATMGGVGLATGAMSLFTGAEGQAFRGKDTALRLMQNTGGFSDAVRKAISEELLKVSSASLLEEPKLIEALQILIANGVETQTALKMLPTIAKGSKGSGTDPADMANLATALSIHMGVKPEDIGKALDVLSTAGKLGSFELNNMAREFPTLGSYFKQLSLTQKDLPAIGAMLQVAKKGAGTPEEAANNMKNFMNKMTANESLQRFQKKGVDIIDLITNPKKYFPEAESGMEAFMLKLQRMTQGGKDARLLSFLFPDMQAKSFILSMLQNWEEYENIKQQSSKESANAIEKDFKNIAQSSESGTQRLSASWHSFSQEVLKSLNPIGTMLADLTSGALDLMTKVLKTSSSLQQGKQITRGNLGNRGLGHVDDEAETKRVQALRNKRLSTPVKKASGGNSTVVVNVASLPSRQQLKQFIAMAKNASQSGLYDLPEYS